MNKTLLSLCAIGLSGFSGSAGAGDAATMAESCLDCHEFAVDFEGVDAAEMKELIEGTLENAKHKATAGLSAEDIQALAEYIAAQASE